MGLMYVLYLNIHLNLRFNQISDIDISYFGYQKPIPSQRLSPMQNRTPLYIAAAAVLLLGAAFYLLEGKGQKQYDWSESSWAGKTGYSEKSLEPYGSSMLHTLLKDYFPDKQLIEIKKDVASELPADTLENTHNYVFVGEALYLDSLGTDQLLKFVRFGNTAFISSKTIPFDLMNYVYYDECLDAPWSDYDSYRDSAVSMSLRTPEFSDTNVNWFFAVQNRIKKYNWNYLDPIVFCDSLEHYPIGYVDSTRINFASFPYGKGRFLLHTNPLVFSNFSMLRPETHPYVEGVLSHLSKGKIYWDAVSRVPEAVGRRRNGGFYDRPDTEHPLTYILRQPALAWAWYLIAGLAGLWLVFRAKRRQAIIPVLKKNENTSYEFISTIANLHFRERNYRSLCEQSMKLFLAKLRERYGLVVAINQQGQISNASDSFFEKLAVVTEIRESEIRNIFNQYQASVRYEPSEQMMVDLHLAMENFWKVAK